MTEIKNLKANGATIIFSSHNMSGVELLSDQLTMLKKVKSSCKVTYMGFGIDLVTPKSMWKVMYQIRIWRLFQVLRQLRNKVLVA